MFSANDTYLHQGQTPDEMVQLDGSFRPAWAEFMEYWKKLDTEDTATRFSKGSQYLRDAGVFYHHYNEGVSTERDWPLNYLPVLLEEEEWTTLSDGLVSNFTSKVAVPPYSDVLLSIGVTVTPEVSLSRLIKSRNCLGL